MPLVTIDLLEGRSAADLDGICGAVQAALVQTLDVPERDRFQIVTEHTRATLRFDPGYLEGDRGDGFVLVRVTLAAGRTVEAKRAFYARLAELLSGLVRPADLAVALVENGREDWSFGDGRASYLEVPRERWR